MSESLIGPLVSIWDVEQAVLGVYREWLPPYLAEVERQHGLANKFLERPPSSESYYGGLDTATEAQYALPAVIVVVKTHGEPEPTNNGYTQAYAVDVNCVVRQPTENEARMLAAHYGAASMLLYQLGALKGLAERTVMAASPDVDFWDPEDRQMMQVTTGFIVYVPNIVTASGPAGETVATSPEFNVSEPEAQPAEPPVVTKTNLTIEPEEV